MPLVNAKCTNCGAPLQVDNIKEAAICPFCNSAYIVEKAIQNYNYYVTQNIKANNVNVTAKGDAEKERLLHNAETNMGFKDYDKAYDIYIQVTEDYPDDYRGWYGLTSIITGNFTKYALEHRTYREATGFMGKALMCVTPDKKDYIKNVWDSFLAKRSEHLSQAKRKIESNDIELAELYTQLSDENRMLTFIKTKIINISNDAIMGICIVSILIIAAIIFIANPEGKLNVMFAIFGSAILIPISIPVCEAIRDSKNKKVNMEIQEQEKIISRLKNKIDSLETESQMIKDKYNIKN